MKNTVGNWNSAFGASALLENSFGNSNAAFGGEALRFATANKNSAFGYYSLYNTTTGSNNIALGYGAGSLITTGHSNIAIGNVGVVDETNTIRIGAAYNSGDEPSSGQDKTFISGIRGAILGGGNAQTVVIDDAGQLSSVVSSAGTVTSVTGSGPVSVATGTTTPAISISQADGTHDGYLAAADFSIFAGKGTGTVTSVAIDPGTTGLTATGTITSAGTIILGGTLAVANGGTGLMAVGTSGTVLTSSGSAVSWVAPVTPWTASGRSPAQLGMNAWYDTITKGASISSGGLNPQGPVFDGTYMWFANNGSGNVTKLKVSDGTTTTFPVGLGPVCVAFDGTNVWITNRTDGTVTVLKASDGSPVRTVTVGGLPFGIAYDGMYMWVGNGADGTVSKIKASDGSVVNAYNTGGTPHPVAFDGNNIWVGLDNTDKVVVLKASDGTPVGTYTVGNTPSALAFDGTNMWVANYGSNSVSKLKASDGTPIGTYNVAGFPFALVFDGTSIWVTDASAGMIRKLKLSDGSILASAALDAWPQGVGFDGVNVWVGVEGNMITKYSSGSGNAGGVAATVTGIVAVANGGTGATDASGARTNLGLATVAATGSYNDLSNKPTIPAVGTIASQNADSVTITGGSITGAALTGNLTGNATTATTAGAVTNGVYTSGDQTIDGTKTFTGKIRLSTYPLDIYSDPDGFLIDNGSLAKFRLLPNANDIYFQNTVSAGNINFTGLNGGDLTGNVIFKTTGKVGVGTATPTNHLEVHSPLITTPTQFGLYNDYANQNNSGSDYEISTIKLGTSLYHASISTKIPNSGFGDVTRLDFSTPTGSNDNTQAIRMSIMPATGNVGIGTKTPAYRLDVAGDVNVTGNFLKNGSPLGGGGTVTSVAIDPGTTGLTATGTITSAGTIILGGTLAIANGGTGAASLSTNGVLLGNGTSAVQAVAPGSAGEALISNGTTWVSQNPRLTDTNSNTLFGTSTPANATGPYNTAFGEQSMKSNTTGHRNSAFGTNALLSNVAGTHNAAVGMSALQNSLSDNNSAFGHEALLSNTTGHDNIAIGYRAGVNLTTGSDNIAIGNAGVAAEANTIRIGTAGNHTRAFVSGIYGITPVATPQTVVIDSSGQLGSVASSSGTVTSVGLSLPSILSVSGSPVTTSGTLSATLASQAANTVFAAPNGSAGAPSFRALVSADIPTLNQNTTGTSSNVTGTVAIANGGTGQVTAASAFNTLVPNQTGNNSKYLTTDGTNTSWGSPPGAAGWSVVSGTTQTAASGGSYLTTNASQTTVTLPATPAAGDVVRIMAKNGSGGWLATANTGQGFGVAGIGSGAWTARGPSATNFSCVASSSDGSKLAAGVNGGQIYTSSDSGVNWTLQPASPSLTWNSIASSSDGVKLVAVANNAYIYTSVDSGASWTERITSGVRVWRSIASSSDGTKLVAGEFLGNIFTSTDSGVTWLSGPLYANLYSLASNYSGTNLVAADHNGALLVSANSGISWAQRESSRLWSSVTIGSNTAKMVATVYGGQIYTSANNGANWTVQAGSPTANWAKFNGVTSSSDGIKLAAVVEGPGGQIYTSSNSGVTWIVRGATSASYTAITSSADGNKLVAAHEGGLYTSPPPNVLSGGSRAGADFLYDGSGEWLLVNTQGTVTAQ
ncbi:MAG: beta strand repeat-containing protein [Desulfuromonadaceae bacterium]